MRKGYGSITLKRAAKSTFALILTLLMLSGHLPFASFITEVKAASVQPTYRWEYVDSIDYADTGATTYLIVNSNTAGSAYAVSVPDGTGERGNADRVAVTINSGSPVYINDSSALKNCEFTINSGMTPSINYSNSNYNSSRTFMFNNPKTGAWLYNDAPDKVESASDIATGRIKVTYDPYVDGYPAATRMVYAANTTSFQTANAVNVSNTTVSTHNKYVKLYAKQKTDPKATLYFPGGVPTSTFPYCSVVYYTYGIGTNRSYRFDLNGSTTNTFYFPGMAKGWYAQQGFLSSPTSGGYTWASGSWAGAGTVTSATFHWAYNSTLTQSDGSYFDLSSILFFKNSYAGRVATKSMLIRCYNAADTSGSASRAFGYYPSHRYLFCQFATQYTNSSNTQSGDDYLKSNAVICATGARANYATGTDNTEEY
ncbi:MAG: hypothetical protein IKN38_08975, partial [Clostridia bacterium]|nr:hypothetical protein [Clostridia bacterium]